MKNIHNLFIGLLFILTSSCSDNKNRGSKPEPSKNEKILDSSNVKLSYKLAGNEKIILMDEVSRVVLGNSDLM